MSETNRKITLAEFIKEYLEHRGSMSPHTQRHDRNALKYLTAPLGGNTPMSLINTKRIDEFKAMVSLLKHRKAAVGGLYGEGK